MTTPPVLPRIALQLYTVRELAAEDLVATVERVAELGYQGVELAGLHGVVPDELHARCAALGLAIVGAHIGVSRFASDPDGVRSELEALGTPMLIFSSLPLASIPVGRTATDWLTELVARAHALGLRPVFHNHAQEFERSQTGERVWDAIVAVETLELELDLGWIWVAGEEPARLLTELAGRVPLVHVKDHIRTPTGAPDRPVGDGDIDYATLVPGMLDAGVEWLVVEQDEPGSDPLAAVSRSLRAVQGLLGAVERRRTLDP